MVDAVLERHGRLDTLVNNAGGQYFVPAEAIAAKGWAAVTRLNVGGTLLMARTAVERAMRPAGGGTIVNVTLSPHNGLPAMAHSSAARAGMAALTNVLANEWGRHGIGLVCVAPGWIDTEGMRQYGDDLEQLAKLVPMGRLGTAEEVADTIAFLASPRARYITGQTVVIDGGIDNTHTSAPGITTA
jgi:citronellol/citronellal dehydrogenase